MIIWRSPSRRSGCSSRCAARGRCRSAQGGAAPPHRAARPRRRGSMSGARVLVVDDNAVNLRLARLLLVQEGYDVRTAMDAAEALAQVGEFSPRLILMDLQMPG